MMRARLIFLACAGCSAGNGWDPPRRLQPGGYAPDVAADPAGNVMAVWLAADGSRASSVWASRFEPGSGWATPTLVEQDADSASDVRVAIDRSGNAIAVWDQGVPSSLWANRFVPGAGWGTAARIEDDDTRHTSRPEIAIDPDGNATVVWSSMGSPSLPGGTVWTNRFVPGAGWGVASSLGNDQAFAPKVAVDATGAVAVAWSQDDGVDSLVYHVWASRFVPASGWEPAIMIGDGTYPRIAGDAAGNVTVAWGEQGIWASRFEPGAGWGTAALVGVGGARCELLADAAGNLTAVWQREDAIETRRFVPGAGWGVAEVVAADVGTSWYPTMRLAADAAGDVTLVWDHGRPDPDPGSDAVDSEIWTRELSPGTGWSAPIVIADDGIAPVVAVDPAGIATAVWTTADARIVASQRE